MAKRKWLYWILSGIVIIGVLMGFFLYHRHAGNSMAKQMQDNSSALDFGIVYLPVTPRTADYYGLGVSSGALVTQVIKDSLIDQAGIKVGDVITSFNGFRIDETEPLLGMMRSCPEGHEITMAVWSNGNTREVAIVHPEHPEP